jgi:hypothetical protein
VSSLIGSPAPEPAARTRVSSAVAPSTPSRTRWRSRRPCAELDGVERQPFGNETPAAEPSIPQVSQTRHRGAPETAFLVPRASKLDPARLLPCAEGRDEGLLCLDERELRSPLISRLLRTTSGRDGRRRPRFHTC